MPLQASSPRSAADERVRATAKWGAACASCASAKAKCIRTNESPESKCDRCERLLKECSGQVHKPRKKRASKPSKTAQLEERLNGLVDLLRSTGELPVVDGKETASPYNPPTVASLVRDELSASSSSGPSPRVVPEPHRSSATAALAATHASDIIHSKPPTIPSTYNSFAPPSCICRPEAGEIATDAVESDEVLLAKFRQKLHPLLPIVVLPTYNGKPATAAQLSAERPFLFLAIKTVASVDNSRSMQGLMYQLISHVADYMLLRAERSLDLVHGLLIILSWYHHHCMMHAQLGNLLHLATSLVCDLNLNRPPRIAERSDLMVLQPNPPSPRTNDERRILLGLWYLRSSVAHCFQKTEPMRYTPYVRQCLQELEDAREVESDAVLVAVVRMQHLAERIAALNSRDEAMDDFPGYPRAPKSAYRIAFQSELDALVGAFPSDLRKHYLIQVNIAALKLRLYEPPVLDLALLEQLSGSLTSVASPATMSTALDTLYAARNALKDFFDLFLSIPIPMFPWLPLPLYAHVIHGTTMLSRWARLIGPVRPPSQTAQTAQPRTDSRSGPGARSSSDAAAAAATGPAAPTSIASQPGGAGSGAPGDPSHRHTMSSSQGATTSSSSSASAPGTGGSTSLMSGVDSRDLQRDPSLHVAVARMREHLRQQPDLMLDIPGMLTAIWDQFEQSNHHMRQSGAAKFGESVGRSMNAWDLTARKIAIMRFKVGRYLDGSSSATGGDMYRGNGRSGSSSHGGGGGGSGTSVPPRQSERHEEPISAKIEVQQHAFRQDQHAEQPAHHGQDQGQAYNNHHDLPYAPPQPSQQYPGYAHPISHHQQQQQQQQPQHHQHQHQQPHQQQQLSSLHNLSFSMHNPGLGTGLPPTAAPPPISGLPPDLGNYVTSGVGIGIVEDLSYGLGNLEGWDNDSPWGADMLATNGPGQGLWSAHMGWQSSTQL